MTEDFRKTKQWCQGRLGEILMIGLLVRFGVEIEDLSDRTTHRAPLLYSLQGTIRSPDANAYKTGRFFPEFKTKRHHFKWSGGSAADVVRVSARTEEGMNEANYQDHLEAQRRWRQPVVLFFLSIEEAEIIAATLQQLGEPRFSPHDAWPLVNWDVRQFTRIATFDRDRLTAFFDSRDPRFVAGRERWLMNMPPISEILRMLEWLRVAQLEFSTITQFVFDQIEKEWA